MASFSVALIAEQIITIKLSLEQSGHCPSSELIHDYVTGLIPVGLKGPVAEHFRKCRNCRILLELDELAVTQHRKAGKKRWCS
jgi:hypothetical protein